MVKIENSIMVVIEDDKKLCTDFLKFQIDNKIFAYRGGSVGMGHLVSWFPAKYKKDIEKFFKVEF
jgi:hypothetical protein